MPTLNTKDDMPIYNSIAGSKNEPKNKMKWVVVFNATAKLRGEAVGQVFNCRLVHCYLRECLTPKSKRHLEDTLLMGRKSLTQTLATLARLNLVHKRLEGWTANDVAGYFEPEYLKVFLPCRGKTLTPHVVVKTVDGTKQKVDVETRWTITLAAMWSLVKSYRDKNKSISPSLAACMLDIDVSHARRCMATLEREGFISRELMLGKVSEITLQPLNGHGDIFAKCKFSKTKKSKPAIKNEARTDLSQKHLHMAQRFAQLQGMQASGWLDSYGNNLKVKWEKTRIGKGCWIAYLEKCLENEYWLKWPARKAKNYNWRVIKARLPWASDKDAKTMFNDLTSYSYKTRWPGQELAGRDDMLDSLCEMLPKSWIDVRVCYEKLSKEGAVG